MIGVARPCRLCRVRPLAASRDRRRRLRHAQCQRHGHGIPSGAYNASDTSIGWAAGVGVDYAITDRWIARLEYLHLSLAGFSPTSALTAGNLTVAYGRLTNDIIRGGINCRLMPW